MPKRNYPFALPHTLSGMETGFGKQQYAALIERLPPRLKAKVEASGFTVPLTITKADLDSLPEPLYRELAAAVGLQG